MALVRSLRGAGLAEQALEWAAEAAGRRSLDPDVRLEEAAILVELGRHEEALDRLEDAVKSLPTNGALAHALAKLLAGVPQLELRDGARAFDLAQRIYEARPTADHAMTLAQALAELGRCSEAHDWQSRAIEALVRSGFAAGSARQRLLEYAAGPPCR